MNQFKVHFLVTSWKSEVVIKWHHKLLMPAFVSLVQWLQVMPRLSLKAWCTPTTVNLFPPSFCAFLH